MKTKMILIASLIFVYATEGFAQGPGVVAILASEKVGKLLTQSQSALPKRLDWYCQTKSKEQPKGVSSSSECIAQAKKVLNDAGCVRDEKKYTCANMPEVDKFGSHWHCSYKDESCVRPFRSDDPAFACNGIQAPAGYHYAQANKGYFTEMFPDGVCRLTKNSEAKAVGSSNSRRAQDLR